MLAVLSLFASLMMLVMAQDQVVFVHGLAGFGPEELLGLNYWGFSGIFRGQDYFAPLRAKGFVVHYASVGPVSSNHDRACELYAQIKGTKVDYGEVHAARYGHARYGKDYTGKGFYSAWDGTKKIHLVGHSMGGNTIRYLEYLLQKGLAEEVTKSGTGVSPLFKLGTAKPGGGNWIQSITTISTPHDGSTLTVKLGTGLVGTIKNLIGTFAAIAGLSGSTAEWGYNFDLDQFGLARKAGEGFWTYYNRVFASSIFSNGFKDLASWDLTPEWSREFNKKTALAYAGTFYFSVATVQTHSCWSLLSGWDHCADLDMELLMSSTANIIGDMDGKKDSTGYTFGGEWEPSDGVVPLRSSKSPQNGITGYVAPSYWGMGGGWVKGRWYTMEVKRDHLQIIGFRLNPLTWNAADGVYDAIADTLNQIKIGTSASENAPTEGTADSVEGGDQDIAAIVGGSFGALAIVLLVAAVLVRRRNNALHEQTIVLVKSGSWASPEIFKSRKTANTKTAGGEEVTVSDVEVPNNNHVVSENPIFAREAAGSNV